MDVYAENILDHYRNPRCKESLANPTISHSESNPTCGDTLTVELLVEDSIIKQVGWTGEGCAISQAAMSLLSENLEGMKLDDVYKLSQKDVHELLGVPIGTRRVKCALLGLHTLKNTVHALQNEPSQPWLETIGTQNN